jgi:hypothetical protein
LQFYNSSTETYNSSLHKTNNFHVNIRVHIPVHNINQLLYASAADRNCQGETLLFYHHNVHEGLGVLARSLILKMKLVPPSLPWSFYDSSSMLNILKRDRVCSVTIHNIVTKLQPI